jgi:hypothetical protein
MMVAHGGTTPVTVCITGDEGEEMCVRSRTVAVALGAGLLQDLEARVGRAALRVRSALEGDAPGPEPGRGPRSFRDRRDGRDDPWARPRPAAPAAPNVRGAPPAPGGSPPAAPSDHPDAAESAAAAPSPEPLAGTVTEDR